MGDDLGLHQGLPQQSRPDLQRGATAPASATQRIPTTLDLLTRRQYHTYKQASNCTVIRALSYVSCLSLTVGQAATRHQHPPSANTRGRHRLTGPRCISRRRYHLLHFPSPSCVHSRSRLEPSRQLPSPISLPSAVPARDEVRSRVQGDP